MENYISGKVIHGLENGRKFGYRTANIEVIEGKIPNFGVYAARIYIDTEFYNGMLYIGQRPSLHLKQQSIEIHIFNFKQDIYDKLVNIQIFDKIRDDIKFNSIETLIKQIQCDEIQIRAILEKINF